MLIFNFHMPEVVDGAFMRNPENPTEKIPLPVELLSVAHCCQKGVLQKVFRNFSLPGHPHQKTEYPVLIPFVERGKPRYITFHPIIKENIIIQ